MPVPRALDDLPYAGSLEPHHGQLAADGYYDAVHLGNDEFDDCQAGHSRFIECAFTGVSFSGGTLRRSRFNDVWLHGTRWVGTDLAETAWTDATILSSVLAGVESFGAKLRRVVFSECKLNSVNFRTAVLQDVVFDNCVLRDVDWGEATLINVRFPGSTLERAQFAKATMKNVDFRGAPDLGVASGCDAMNGAVIDSGQLMQLAPMLAHTLGITVEDR
jgi:uncharacterized protein YjbI with pentapeptide repeats